MGTILVTKKSRIKFLLGAYILGRVENLEIHKQKKKKKNPFRWWSELDGGN